jgi:hypothetical protein
MHKKQGDVRTKTTHGLVQAAEPLKLKEIRWLRSWAVQLRVTT